jgi:hypothetical protein
MRVGCDEAGGRGVMRKSCQGTEGTKGSTGAFFRLIPMPVPSLQLDEPARPGTGTSAPMVKTPTRVVFAK